MLHPTQELEPPAKPERFSAGAVATVAKALPESSLNILIVAVAACAIAALAFYAFQKRRGVA